MRNLNSPPLMNTIKNSSILFSESMIYKNTVALSCISIINCDICVVFNYENSSLNSKFFPKSRACLFTVNNTFVGSHIETEATIISLAMTNLTEGTGINCLFLGLNSGLIKYFNYF